MYVQGQHYGGGYGHQQGHPVPASYGNRRSRTQVYGEQPAYMHQPRQQYAPAPIVVEKEDQGCCSGKVCCWVTLIILSILTLFFFLNFYGVIPLGYAGGQVDEVYHGIKVSVGAVYKGPWGTSVWISIDGEKFCEHYFWFRNLFSKTSSPLTQSEAIAIVKSFVRDVPKFLKAKTIPLMDRFYGTDETYRQLRPLIQELVHVFGDFDWQKLITLAQNNDYEGIKNLLQDNSFKYLRSGRADRFVPGEFQPVYQDFKQMLLGKEHQLRSLTLQDWNEIDIHSRLHKVYAQTGNGSMMNFNMKQMWQKLEAKVPNFRSEVVQILHRYNYLTKEVKKALTKCGFDFGSPHHLNQATQYDVDGYQPGSTYMY